MQTTDGGRSEALSTLTRRIVALESRLTRERRVAGAVLLALAGLVVLGASRTASLGAQAQSLRVRELVVEDASGRARVWLGTPERGGAGIGLLDELGQVRAELYLAADGNATRLLLSDRGGRSRLHAGLADDGRPHVELAGEDGRSAFEVGLGADGARRLRLGDEPGAQVELRVLGDGRPGLELRGAGAPSRVALGLTADGAPGIELRDGEGRTVFSRP